MNVINDVLNELEKRGATAPLGEAAVRAVPPRRELHLVRYALLAVLLLGLMAAVTWFAGRAETPPPGQSVPPAAAMAVVAPFPASAIVAAASAPGEAGVGGPSQPDGGLHGKQLLEAKNEAQTVVAPVARKSARHRGYQSADQAGQAPGYLSADNGQNEPLKKISSQQRAEQEFSKANLAAQEGRTDDALAGYEAALLIDSSYKEARRAWVGLLIGLKRNDDAERVLQKGMKRDPHDASFAMLLARLQVERKADTLALETLQKALPYAEDQADYQAFLAALLQRQGRHDDAIAHYQIALKLVPANGIWLMGIGISLQATQRTADAREAYQRALASNTLSPQLLAFVQARLKEL